MTQVLKRILFIEDEADIRTVAKMALEMVGGFEVRACASGAEGVAAALDAKADLVLLDVMMPGMDGPATLKALRAIPQTAATPVIFMTAKVQSSEVAGYKALGALAVIPKPFSPMDLANQIRGIWERRNP
jgi:two-component system, OmpR family, response regulator